MKKYLSQLLKVEIIIKEAGSNPARPIFLEPRRREILERGFQKSMTICSFLVTDYALWKVTQAWLKRAHSKCVRGVMPARVRIPHLPLLNNLVWLI